MEKHQLFKLKLTDFDKSAHFEEFRMQTRSEAESQELKPEFRMVCHGFGGAGRGRLPRPGLGGIIGLSAGSFPGG